MRHILLNRSIEKIAAALFVIALFFAIYGLTFAETNTDAEEARLRAELANVEKEIAAWEGMLKDAKTGSASLQKDVAALTAKIEKAKLVIKAKNIEIDGLVRDIKKKNTALSALEERLERGRDSMADIIRKVDRKNTQTFMEVVLSNQNISGFFADVDSYSTIERSLGDLFNEIEGVKRDTEKERKLLSEKKDKETNTKVAIEAENRLVQKNEAEKKELLQISKTKEKTYAQVVKGRQQKAAEIRAALFALRDTAAIPFGTALTYAKNVERETGVRPAFLLAIITQESDLGRNLGSCLVNNLDTGDGSGKNSGTFFEQVMKAPRDTTPFLGLMTRLGRDWKLTPVSCPPSAKYYVGRGYGGGMGPSQFIPSTWEIFKDRIGKMLGTDAEKADPWNPLHSFMATGIYVGDLGANSGTYTAERDAACRYYSGASCQAGRRPANIFYGDQVMQKAANIQENMIDPLEGF